MNIKPQKCYICQELHDVVMTSPRSRYIKICLECYVDMDTRNRKDYGLPEVKRNKGTHASE